ncbi:MAG: hypothetical protein EBE86_028320 [Hormoscilla sp. GUM202]|nr:hypothetical protein [Hormoscilla sp. GUM202]
MGDFLASFHPSATSSFTFLPVQAHKSWLALSPQSFTTGETPAAIYRDPGVMPVVARQIGEICPYITPDRPFDTGTQKNLEIDALGGTKLPPESVPTGGKWIIVTVNLIPSIAESFAE